MPLTPEQLRAGLAVVNTLTEGSGKSIKADPGRWVEAIGQAVLDATPEEASDEPGGADAPPWVCTWCQQTNSGWCGQCGRCERSRTEPDTGPWLSLEAETDREIWQNAGGGCSCHLHPPCSSCTDPGNPANQVEDDECWTTDPTRAGPSRIRRG